MRPGIAKKAGCVWVGGMEDGFVAMDPDEFRETLAEIGRTTMPFGKYGPEAFPPRGTPIYDLPFEYLQWFAERSGFPSGRLGELMELIYHVKKDGSDGVFDLLRQRAGGRSRLRGVRERRYDFGEG